MSLEDIAPLDELRLTVVVDNETDTLSSIDPGVPQVPEAVGLLARLPAAREFAGHPGKVVFDRLCCACHGFSVLATGRRGDRRHTLLFDVGPYASVWKDNAARLGIDLAAIEGVFLSHWHFDHSGGFPDVVAAIAEARREHGLSPPFVDLHPDRPDQRGVLLPTGMMLLLPEEPRFEQIEAAGGRVIRHDQPHTLLDGFFFASGRIERVTPYETGLAGHHSFHGEQGEPDPLILDERFVAGIVQGRGVTVLSACSHAGVINACLGAQRQFAGAPIDLVLGGYHLSGKAMEARIEPTIADLKERIRPRVVAPGHCTGWRAKAALARAFAPTSYGPSVVGSSYVLTTP
jgi:7,8-dihydropterin-6-yl-methyl-4-(beta-D-ribofuranosyl)aminobenzene 5'-phosphate synthase